MLMAKIKLTDYLSALTQEEYQNPDLKNLEIYLENFYLFLEALTEYLPDKRATIRYENLKKIMIQNEYDLQHLLYAALKPLYPGIRKEVSKDSGIGTVREDIFIPDLDVVLEAKCTRDSMTLKKLIEEIEADIVHYHLKNIFCLHNFPFCKNPLFVLCLLHPTFICIQRTCPCQFSYSFLHTKKTPAKICQCLFSLCVPAFQ